MILFYILFNHVELIRKGVITRSDMHHSRKQGENAGAGRSIKADVQSHSEDQKIVLRASQLLEELKRFTNVPSSCENKKSTPSQNRNIFYLDRLPNNHFRNLVILQTRLKQLLLQRYVLLLRNAYIKAIGDCEILFKECWLITESEKVKLRNLPVLSCNPFPEKYFFDLVSCKMFPEKLFQRNLQWHTIDRNLQRALSLFHTGFNYSLVHIFYYSFTSASCLQRQLLCLISLYLDVCLEKLCCLDSNNVSSEFVSSVLETCSIFNDFFTKIDNTRHNSTCCNNNHSFRFLWSFKNEMNLTYLLTHLADFQACISANRIVCALTSNAQKKVKVSHKTFKLNWLSDDIIYHIDSSEQITSDYSSASFSETDPFCEVPLKTLGLKEQVLDDVDSGFLSALRSILQKSQALLLKYLFTVKSANTTKMNEEKKVSFEKSFTTSSELQKTWEISLCKPIAQNCCSLEQIFWLHFWKKTDEFLFRLLMEIPMHHCGDIFPGTVILWDENFIAALLKILSTCESDDISTEGQKCLKNMFFHIFMFVSLMDWDKSFCAAAKLATLFHCVPVPLADGNLGTKPGIVFCAAFRPLLAVCLFCLWHPVEVTYIFKAINGLLSTMDCFQSWALMKKRALLSAWSIPTCLVITYSDIALTEKLVSHILLSECDKHFPRRSSLYVASTLLLNWKKLHKTLDAIKAFNGELPILVQIKVHKFASKCLSEYKKTLHFWAKSATESDSSAQHIIEDILKPTFETTLQIKSMPEKKWEVFKAAITAVAQSYLTPLELKQRQRSSHHFDILCNEVTQLLAWVEDLSQSEDGQNVVQHVKSTEKFQALTTLLELSKSHLKKDRPKLKRANKILPL